MAPAFGTSGLRGLVTELTDEVVTDYVGAFLGACDTGGRVCLGRDLRESSPRIAAAVRDAALAAGVEAIDCGALPTPALALAAEDAGAGAVMVTGSHIPADRNGLKFYARTGEITKAEEQAITAALGSSAAAPMRGSGREDAGAAERYVSRYVRAFGADALAGRRIGVYAHAAVGRDLLRRCLASLGADTVELARSETFVPVDTEAVDRETRERLAGWAAEHSLDAIASTDGDSDRPMLTDETGRMVPGDVLGQITAESLGADIVVTPISSNGGVLQKGFARVVRTRIGSPFVIAAMQEAGGRVVGYEANGGFLLGFTASTRAGDLRPLLTRDSFLPMLAALVAAGEAPLSRRVAAEPPRFTATDRLKGIATDRSAAWLAGMQDPAVRDRFLSFAGHPVRCLDRTDGMRFTLENGEIVHLRPSGNAPEFRFYAEADTDSRAAELLAGGLQALRQVFG